MRPWQAFIRASALFLALPGPIVSVAAEPRVRPDLRARAAQHGTAPVIVGLAAATQPEGYVRGAAAIADQRARIRRAQHGVLANLPAASYRLVRQFEVIAYLALEATPDGLAALAAQPEVSSITEDALLDPALVESVPLLGGDIAWQDGLTGAGQTVAILDTGVESTHPFVSGKVVAEACFSKKSLCPNSATTQTGAGAAVPCDGPLTCNHGTHVAGIAAGSGPDFAGVARDASIVAIQVFSRMTGSECEGTGEDPCYRTTVSDVIAALEHVYALRTTYAIAAANLSLSGGKYTSQATCDHDSAAYKAIIDTLRSAGIAAVAASGNSFYTDGLGTPACVSSAVSVGATTKSDTIAGFSNSAAFLSLLAPGDHINSAALGGGFRFSSGTSMAAPHVAGAWAVLRQANPSATVDSILTLLQSSGVPVADPRNGVTIPRIDLDAALQVLPGDCTTAPIAGGAASAGPPAEAGAAGAGGIGVVRRPSAKTEPRPEHAGIIKRTAAPANGGGAALDVVAERAYLRTGQDAGDELPIPTIGQNVYFHADWRVDGSGGPITISARAVRDGTTFCTASFEVSGGEGGVIFCNASWRVASGTHTLRWEFDYDHRVSESDEGNNSASATWASSNGFDFVAQRAFLKTASNAGVEVVTPSTGQTVYFHFDLQVVGPDRQTSISVRASLDGTQFCAGSVDKGPGLYTIGCTQGWTATAGTHTLRWDVDHTGAVPETNESNNSASTTWSSGTVDLAAERAYWRSASAAGGSDITTPEPYQRMYAHADWRVTGTGGPVAVNQRALLDGAVLCSCQHTAATGDAYTSSCKRNWRVLPGAHTLRWEIDYDNTVGETDEGNNIAETSTATAAAQVDLIAERAFLRTGANSGDEVTTATQDERVFAHFTWSISGATEPVTVQLRAREGGFEWCRATYTTTSARVTHWCGAGLKFNPGGHTLQWDLDFVDEVPETAEANNTASADFTVTSLTPGATVPPTRTHTPSRTPTKTPTFPTPTRSRTPTRTATMPTPTITQTPSKTATVPSPTPTATVDPDDRDFYPRGDSDCSIDVVAADLLAAARAVAGAGACGNDDCNRDGRITTADLECTAGCIFGECPPPPSAPRATAVRPVTAPAIWPFSVVLVDVVNLGANEALDRVAFNGVEAEVIGREGTGALRVVVPEMEPGPTDAVVLAGDVAGPPLRITVSAEQSIGVVDNAAGTLDVVDQSSELLLALDLETLGEGGAAEEGTAANIIALIPLIRDQIQAYQSAVRQFAALLRDPEHAGWAALDHAIESSGLPERLKALLPDLVSTAISERDKLQRAAEVYAELSRVLDAAGRLKRTLDPLVAAAFDQARAEMARLGTILADELKALGDRVEAKIGMVTKVAFSDAAGNARNYPTAGGSVRVFHKSFGLFEEDDLIMDLGRGLIHRSPEDSGDGFYDYRIPDRVGLCGPIRFTYSELSGLIGLGGLRSAIQPELLDVPSEPATSREARSLLVRGTLGCTGRALFTRQVSNPPPPGVHRIEASAPLAPLNAERARVTIPLVPPDHYDVKVRVGTLESEEPSEIQIASAATGLVIACGRTEIEFSSDPANRQSTLCTAIAQPNIGDIPSSPGSGFKYQWRTDSDAIEIQQDDPELGIVTVLAKRLGTARIRAEALTDSDTFVADTIAPLAITVADTGAPAVSLSTVESDLRAGGFIKFKATATDTGALTRIVLTATGEPAGTLDLPAELPCGRTGSCSRQWTLSLKRAEAFSDGHLYARAEAFDEGGNSASSNLLEFFVEPAPTAIVPSATPTPTAPGGTATRTRTPTPLTGVTGDVKYAGLQADGYVPAARVSVLDPSRQLVGEGLTDINGKFEITGVPTGDVIISVAKLGLATTSFRYNIRYPGVVSSNWTGVTYMYRANDECQSDLVWFDIVQGAPYRYVTTIPLGEADFTSEYNLRISHPDAATVCLSGNPARPTIRWNPAWYDPCCPVTGMSVAEVSDVNGSNRRELFSVKLSVPIGSPEHLTPPLVYGEDPGIGTVRGIPAPDLRRDGTLYQATVHGVHLFFRLRP